jgi:DNA repair protein RadA
METEVLINQETILEDMEPVEEAPSKTKKKSKGELTLEDLPGVGAATAEKLASSGFDNLIAVAVATPGQLVDASGVSEVVARKMINSARDMLEMGFESGNEVLKKRERVIKISTGSKAFDAMMSGGFETGAITECFGEFGSGKTQVGHILAVNIIKAHPKASVVYIDTENTFRPERIIQLANGIGIDPVKALKQIRVAKAYNSDHQMLLAQKVPDLMRDEDLDVKLVVVDSVTAHFRAEFVGRGTLAERQQKLNKHMHVLSRLADTHNLCVYVTNQVMHDPAQFFGDPTKPAGGNIVGHASTFRIYLRKGKKGTRVAKLIDAPNLADAECGFAVEESGLKDLKIEKAEK